MAYYVSNHGIVVHEPSEANHDPDYFNRGLDGEFSKFEGRRPLLWDEDKRHLYLGKEDWTHHDLEGHFDLRPHHYFAEGYVAGGPQWHNGELRWTMGAPPEHPQVAQALEETGIPVPNPEIRPGETDQPLWMQPDISWGEDTDWTQD